MKKRVFIVFVMILIAILYLQFARQLTIVNTFNATSDKEKEVSVIVITNKLYIKDKTNYSNLLLNKFESNSFSQVKFSTDLTTPQKINFTVYTSRWTYTHFKPDFIATYTLSPDNKTYMLHIE